MVEVQLVETFGINAIDLRVSIATKASRCSYASKGRQLVDFSMTRIQGVDTGLFVILNEEYIKIRRSFAVSC